MYHVLIADDEAIIREGIKCLFDWESMGYTITGEAVNGEQALEKILSQTPSSTTARRHGMPSSRSCSRNTLLPCWDISRPSTAIWLRRL